MKPLKLMMSAFGPYKDKVEIDFRKIGDNGLFLIAGDTGSGKTTIFDAISFVLFGEASGSRRDNSSFRSDFADDNVGTFVELEFIHKDILYKVERIPRYMRRKKKGEGMTSAGGEANLVYLDQVVTGEKNVTEKCIEILGMNANQFKQIVMIAQGEFMELLLAKPKDRAGIFRHIFDTGIYKAISDSLKSRYLVKRREYEDSSLSIKGYIQGVLLDNELLGDESTDQVLELLDKEISRDKELEESLESDRNLVFEESSKLIKTISEGKIINDSIGSLTVFQDKLNLLLERENEILEKEKVVQRNKAIWDLIMPKYLELERLKKDIDDKKERLKKNEVELVDFLPEYKNISKQYYELEKKLDDVQDYRYTIDVFKKRIDILDDIDNLNSQLEGVYQKLSYCRLVQKKEIVLKFNIYKDKVKELEELRHSLVCEKDDYIKRNREYLDSYDLFFSAQAGILASKLNKGEACPVCGSIEHPCLAQIVDNVLSKEELDKEHDRLEEASQRIEKIRIELLERERELDILKRELADNEEEKLLVEIEELEIKCKDIELDVSEVMVEDLALLAQELEFSINEKNNELNKRDTITYILSNYTINKELSEKLEKELMEVESSHDMLLQKREQLESWIEILSKDISKLTNEMNESRMLYYEATKKKVKFDSVIQLLNKSIINLADEIELLNKEYIDVYRELGYSEEADYLGVRIERDELINLEKCITEYRESLSEVTSKITTLEDIIRGRDKVDVDALEERLEDVNRKLSDVNLFLKNINNKISNNTKIYSNLKSVSEKTTMLEKQVMIYKDLSDTANGTIAGKSKLEFEQFVQATYFDRVLASANKRFGCMTEERYQLVRKEEASKVSDKLGLELEVMDYYTGKRRDVKSLSGGESFKAALSLALGMSDTIQEFSGGVVVEAMFIDEGFGSLDDESLEQAMNAIMMLSQGNKLIGIISHVNELKSRIDKKIVVKKSNCGSEISLVV